MCCHISHRRRCQGVFLGCLLSNLLCGAAALDVVFGSLATLIEQLDLMFLEITNGLYVCPPILSNTIIIPLGAPLRLWF